MSKLVLNGVDVSAAVQRVEVDYGPDALRPGSRYLTMRDMEPVALVTVTFRVSTRQMRCLPDGLELTGLDRSPEDIP